MAPEIFKIKKMRKLAIHTLMILIFMLLTIFLLIRFLNIGK